MAVIKNLTIDQYSNWEKTVTLYDQNRSPFDLSNYTAFADIKKYPNTTKIASFDCEILPPKSSGNIVLSLDYDTLLGIKPGQYQYDILLVSIDNVKIRAVEGTVTVNGNITV